MHAVDGRCVYFSLAMSMAFHLVIEFGVPFDGWIVFADRTNVGFGWRLPAKNSCG